MKSISKYAVVILAALLVLIGAAIVVRVSGMTFTAGALVSYASLFSFAVFGAVTVTYQYPSSATPTATTPPKNTIRGTVTATADADTTATVTTAFGLSAGALALGQPEVTLIPLKTQFYLSTWIVAYTDGNTITLTKSGAAGGVAGAQLGFVIRRPHSIAI